MNSQVEIFKISVDWVKPEFVLTSNWWVISPIVILTILIFVWRWCRSKRLKSQWQSQEVLFKIKTGVFEYQNKIQRSQKNLEIAHRIYIELVTRKAAIPFDENNDVISEVYTSWYNMFQIIRTEIKGLSGEFIASSKATSELVKLTVDILNKGLRPHLTVYQAGFRKWYEKELEKPDNDGLTPQEIQRKFDRYEDLVSSMKEVNLTLKQYSEQLHKLIDGESEK